MCSSGWLKSSERAQVVSALGNLKPRSELPSLTGNKYPPTSHATHHIRHWVRGSGGKKLLLRQLVGPSCFRYSSLSETKCIFSECSKNRLVSCPSTLVFHLQLGTAKGGGHLTFPTANRGKDSPKPSSHKDAVLPQGPLKRWEERAHMTKYFI